MKQASRCPQHRYSKRISSSQPRSLMRYCLSCATAQGNPVLEPSSPKKSCEQLVSMTNVASSLPMDTSYGKDLVP